MAIFESFKKAAESFIDDYNTPESFKKGQKFENYTRDVIFSSERYKLIKKTHDYIQNSNDYVQDSLEPDFKFECLETRKQFYVESKFRSWFYQGKIEFCKAGQFKRLQEINKKEPVFILLGLDGDPDDPHYVCLIPLRDIKSTTLTEKFLGDYDISNKISISPKTLWSSIGQDIPTNVKNANPKNIKMQKSNNGYCIRCKSEILINVKHPFCNKCYGEWNKYKTPDFTEKYCHVCGNANKGSFSKPMCYSCYKINS